jgi:hypothetical protein
MPSVGFEPTTPVTKQLQTYALDSVAITVPLERINKKSSLQSEIEQVTVSDASENKGEVKLAKVLAVIRIISGVQQVMSFVSLSPSNTDQNSKTMKGSTVT